MNHQVGGFADFDGGTITDLIQVPRTGGRNTSAPVLTCLCHRGIYHNHSLLPDKIQTRVNKQNEFIRILPQLLQRSKRCQGHYSTIYHGTSQCENHLSSWHNMKNPQFVSNKLCGLLLENLMPVDVIFVLTDS